MRRPNLRPIAIAFAWALLAVATMLALFQGDWSDYLIPLALWAATVFLLALRWQTVAWLRGGRSAVVGRAIRTVALSQPPAGIACDGPSAQIST